MDFSKEVQDWLTKFFKRYDLKIKVSVKKPWDALKLLDKLEVKESLQGQIEQGVKWDVPIIIGKGSSIKFPSRIEGPVLIGENTVIGPFAYIRGPCIIGDDCKIGSSEVKNSIIMDKSNAAHFAYVGDSVIGKGCNLGAGTKIANLRLDGEIIKVQIDDKTSSSGLRKLGAILESNVQIGCNAVLNPGTYAKKNAKIFPGSVVSKFVK